MIELMTGTAIFFGFFCMMDVSYSTLSALQQTFAEIFRINFIRWIRSDENALNLV
jgi:hypothetical protein